MDKLEEWTFVAITKVRGDDAKFKPRSITLLSILHLKQDGGRSARNAERHDTHTASDGDDIEAKGLKEIKENYKEVNGQNQIKKLNEMKAGLIAKMTVKDNSRR